MKRILGALAIVVLLAANAQAALIVEYQFDTGLTPASTATFEHPDVTASPLIDSDGVLNYNITVGTPAPSVFKTYGELATDTGGTFTAFTGNFYEFTVLADFGMQMDLTSLVFNAQKTLAGSPDNPTGDVFLYVRSDVTGFSSNTGAFSLTGGDTQFVLDLTTNFGPAFQNRPEATFQIYLFDGGGGTADQVRIDDVRLNGIVEVVPEPASMVVWSLLGAAGLGLSYFRRRKVAA